VYSAAIESAVTARSVEGVVLILTLAGFFASVMILDLFDISLPRGDSIGVSGAILVAALLQFGLVPATAISVFAMVTATAFKRAVTGHFHLRQMLVVRTVALVLTWLVGVALSSGPALVAPTLVYLVVPASYLISEMLLVQVGQSWRSGRPLLRLVTGALHMQFPIMLAQWSAAVLLLIIYPRMGPWSLIPVVVLLLLMRQSAALLLQIRDTYRQTVEVLVEAAECQDPDRLGHSERTASIARQIAMRMGLSGRSVERISFVALLHDIDALAEKAGAEVSVSATVGQGHSAEVLQGAEFFADVLPILRICDGRPDAVAGESEIAAALVVALASDVDALENPSVSRLHLGSTSARVSPYASPQLKVDVISAALLLGYKIPAVV